MGRGFPDPSADAEIDRTPDQGPGQRRARTPTPGRDPAFEPHASAQEEHLTQVTQVLDELAAAGWLNEQRAAEQLVQAKSARYGQRRLRQLLSQRAIDPDTATASLAAVRDTELDRARQLWCRRFGTPAADLREKARQQRFLVARGFEGAVVDRVLKEASQGRLGEDGSGRPSAFDSDD